MGFRLRAELDRQRCGVALVRSWPFSMIHRAGRGRQLCPGISDVNFLGNLDGIVNLNTEITDGALNFGVAEQELNRTQISGSAVN